MEDVADYKLAVVATAEKFGTAVTVNFTLSIENGCDVLAKVEVRRTIEPIVYFIGTDPVERSLAGLFNFDVSFCQDEFIYTVTCVACQPGTILN